MEVSTPTVKKTQQTGKMKLIIELTLTLQSMEELLMNIKESNILSMLDS